jgi:hypothetical protein
VETHNGATEAHPRAILSHPWAAKAHPGAVLSHPGAAEVRRGAMLSHPGAAEVRRGAMLSHPRAAEAYTESVAQFKGKVCRLVTADLRHSDKKSDPDPYQSEKSDLDPHQSEKSDPDPHQSEIWIRINDVQIRKTGVETVPVLSFTLGTRSSQISRSSSMSWIRGLAKATNFSHSDMTLRSVADPDSIGSVDPDPGGQK